MFQGSLGLVVVLVIVIVIVSLVLLGLVIVFKISRDRRERRAERFRDRLWKAWVANDTGQLVKTYRIVARGGHQAAFDVDHSTRHGHPGRGSSAENVVTG